MASGAALSLRVFSLFPSSLLSSLNLSIVLIPSLLSRAGSGPAHGAPRPAGRGMAPAEARGQERLGPGGGCAARPRRLPAVEARRRARQAVAPCRRPGEGFFFHFQICRSIMLNPFLENLVLYNFSYNFRSLSSWLECCEAFPAPHPFLLLSVFFTATAYHFSLFLKNRCLFLFCS